MSYSAIEESLSYPTYTYNTIKKLQEISYEVQFSLIIGADNLKQLHTWHKIDELLTMVNFIVIPRGDIDCDKEVRKLKEKYVTKDITILNDCPQSNLSSTFIRNQLKQGKTIDFYVPERVSKHINNNRLYF